MLNKSCFMGRLVRDPELRTTQSGTPVSTYTIAVDRGRKGDDGKSIADFVDCVAWDKKSDFAQNWLTKGMLIAVCGRMQSRSWEDKHKQKRTSWELIIEEQHFCESKRDRAPSPADCPEAYGIPNASDTEFSELGDDSDVPF